MYVSPLTAYKQSKVPARNIRVTYDKATLSQDSPARDTRTLTDSQEIKWNFIVT